MSNRNGRVRRSSPDRLTISDADTIALSDAVHDRFVRVADEWLRSCKEQLPIPKEIDQDLLRWRTMVVRFKSGDFRNTESELMALKTIAQWTVDVNNQLRNQPDKRVKWKEGSG